ncbi:MAG: GNAT family N-acetyltransferase [Bacteroidia bacterium]|nr:GNAT family N-acetyltransferase [Bacteroidia bacterium]MDW8134638.1 GNAT family N-acetyltransferase [Bacteroidia bacterium]
MRPGPISVMIAGLETVLPLRWQVLRPGKPISQAYFAGDNEKTTWHFAAYNLNCEVVGVASFFLEAYSPLGDYSKSYRLRGMATHPAYQRKAGIGRKLLTETLNFLKKRGVSLVWCYARLAAVPFYAKQGFQRWEAAGVIEIPDVGPHEVWYYPLENGA